ncbi:hypothetical protein H310_11730 [Aphanomyces invadans]|uniref:Rab-GAP TBC domain-containing protein n=1 Tax=Aphanomyces invadans TaxID=157072 RepID=A0A024TL93_9STRA|nr:hypothetical protein H310_11730 [Aphanomyces invadans]ETV94774.1 hypothetical protein H310_11730 [Aphanomyces invadans]|eukprot:XP_008876719.1 hypothetical protein H310_11730 [Aphanomyces invadans]
MTEKGSEGDGKFVYAEATVDEKVGFIFDRMKESSFLGDCRNKLKSELKRQLNNMEGDEEDFHVNLTYMMQRLGLVHAIKTFVMDIHTEGTKDKRDFGKQNAALVSIEPDRREALEAIEVARKAWEAFATDSLREYVRQTSTPLVVYHENVSSKDAPETTKPNVASRFLFSSDDFLTALQRIAPLNRSPHVPPHPWSSIHPLLRTRELVEIQQQYTELSPSHAQYGLDEDVPNIHGDYVYIQGKNKLGDKVLQNGTVPTARQYAKTGSPITLRPHIWRQALSVAIDPIYFQQLEAKVRAMTFATDGLFMLDVQQTTDSSDYFPFEDHLRSVMLAFSRDEQVASQAVMTLQHPVLFHNTNPTAEKTGSNVAIPPANVMPYHGLVMFVAPLCYLYDDPVHVYFVFRDMYCRYWCQLTGISARPNSILALCKTFETLVHRHIPAVVQHLLQHEIVPLVIAFPWIQSAFSGVLEIDQVLLLWDRVVGYDSLEIIAIFAAALFTFRSHELLQVTKIDDVRDLFTEALEIQVMPILQQFLFPIFEPHGK